ncbi:hypothetical protein CLOM_g6390 [Closterium sp. NIES-68]|nr:hypothetical protein CLOM_g6390 [Closterium sp. NIES-68]GJP68569.1 hypothetical protein CLOP_g25249 [Closterium sp. NIES-67]
MDLVTTEQPFRFARDSSSLSTSACHDARSDMSATSRPQMRSDGPEFSSQATSAAAAVLDPPVPASTPPFVARVAAVPSPASSSVAVEAPPRHTSSKYDFVKVRVWLGENDDHYYVLSRFLIARMLTVTRMPHVVATKVALELKKLLVDHGLLDVSQGDLERNLFALMRRRGYGDDYVGRYRMMTSFYQRRIPLVIFITGLPCTGKSSIASLLAQRLNLPNVLQTDVVYELLQGLPESPLHALPLWARADLAGDEDVVAEFCRECKIIRKGLEGDLSKALREGKPVIIEGTHIDPDANFLSFSAAPPPVPVSLPPPPAQAATPAAPLLQPQLSIAPAACGASSGDASARWGPMGDGREGGGDDPMEVEGSELREGAEGQGAGGGEGGAMVEEERDSRACGRMGDGNQGNGSAGEMRGKVGAGRGEREQARGARDSVAKHLPSDPAARGSPATAAPPKAPEEAADAASGAASKRLRPVVVPIVLQMHPADHKVLLSEWIASHAPNAALLSQVPMEALLSRMQAVQRYLSSFHSQGVHVADISSTSFPRTIDNLHAHLLACIEQRCRQDAWSAEGAEGDAQR